MGNGGVKEEKRVHSLLGQEANRASGEPAACCAFQSRHQWTALQFLHWTDLDSKISGRCVPWQTGTAGTTT